MEHVAISAMSLSISHRFPLQYSSSYKYADGSHIHRPVWKSGSSAEKEIWKETTEERGEGPG